MLEELGKTDIYLIDLLMKNYVQPGDKVLDAGCGNGRNLPLLLQLGLEVYGLDNDPERVTRTQQMLKEKHPDFQTANIRTARIEEMTEIHAYNLVICNAVLHFSENLAHFKKMMDAMINALVPGGTLFIRLVTSHTLPTGPGTFNKVLQLPDGTSRYVADEYWLKAFILEELKMQFSEPFKTVNVDGQRSMTTLVLTK